MRTAICALLVLVALCAFAPLRAGQDDQTPPAEEPPPSVGPRQANRDLLVRMQGCWRLTDASISGLAEEGRIDRGILLVCEEFLSIEIHVVYEERSESVDELLQTGTFRLRFNHEGILDTTSLIGSLGEEEEFRFVPPGERGSYRAEFASELLVLTNRRDGSRYTFASIPASPDYAGDFFGRRAKVEPGNDDGRR